ncbi:MAG TPA: LCP family protein [Jatrophihabitans sp.]|nr:LCP family protein [Jatrophihabitans sp.]
MASPYRADPSAPLPPHLDPRGRHRRHGGGGGRGGARVTGYRLLGRSIGVVVSAGLLLLSGYVWLTYRSIDAGVHRLKVAVNAPPSGKKDIDGSAQNILLVGIDDRTNMTAQQVKQLKVGFDGGSLATDTLMILHVPANGAKATLISLPRDSYVSIPGHGKNKLNSAYSAGYNAAGGSADQKRTAGADVLLQTITNLTGLTINHYVQISFMGFYDISTAIGGVPVNLCHAVNDTVAYNRSIGSDGGSGLHMSAGQHVLQGVTALEFVRQRHNLPNGDLDRVRRQQYFLAAAFRKVASVGLLFKLNSLGGAIKKDVYMDPGLHLTGLATQMEQLSANNIIGKTIPFEGFDNNSPVGSVEIVNPAKVQKFVQRLISDAPASKPSTSTTHSSGTKTAGSGASSSSSSSKSSPLSSKCIN